VQKAHGWPEQVKAEWDADTWASRDIRVVLLGSSPLLVQRGLTESLAGRFESVRSTHWTFAECRDAFGWDLDTFLFHGGYPGAARYLGDHDRWRAYILDSIVETTVSRDVLLLTRIDKPALLRRLFQLACEYSGQELSYRKMIGQLTDAGNTTTLAHYLDLLAGTGLVTGLQKHSGRPVRRRSSSPKLLVMNTALMTALSGARFAEARSDSALWGRIVESAVGAHLLAVAQREGGELRYWRDGPTEVDFVTVRGRAVTAVEVKSASGAGGADYRGLELFRSRFPGSDTLLVGAGGTPLETFFGGTA
jgi:predicted AAA+ superfamily ATPase